MNRLWKEGDVAEFASLPSHHFVAVDSQAPITVDLHTPKEDPLRPKNKKEPKSYAEMSGMAAHQGGFVAGNTINDPRQMKVTKV